MDTKNEDTMVRQIEKNLSNNINEDLFLTGRVLENNRLSLIKGSSSEKKDIEKEQAAANGQNYPLVSYDNTSTVPMNLSRAEYIRQAREACLRQLSSTQLYSRPYDVNYMDSEAAIEDKLGNNKDKAWKLLNDSQSTAAKEENTPQEIASYRSLIIRTVCAVVLFLSIFIIDKFELNIGKLTYTMIREYVTGNDTLQNLEDIIVTWLK